MDGIHCTNMDSNITCKERETSIINHSCCLTTPLLDTPLLDTPLLDTLIAYIVALTPIIFIAFNNKALIASFGGPPGSLLIIHTIPYNQNVQSRWRSEK